MNPADYDDRTPRKSKVNEECWKRSQNIIYLTLQFVYAALLFDFFRLLGVFPQSISPRVKDTGKLSKPSWGKVLVLLLTSRTAGIDAQ